MATRSTIAILRDNGTVAKVYAHWDGYLEHNGRILVENYNTAEKVEALLAHGDISVLGTEVGIKHPFSSFENGVDSADYERLYGNMTTYYGRDRGESGTAAKVYKDLETYEREAQFEEFNYLFMYGEWAYVSYDGKVRLVTEGLEKLNAEEVV